MKNKKKLVCENCKSKKLFKGSLCEDCWYEEELKRLKKEDEIAWSKLK